MGCTIHSGRHEQIETRNQPIPQMLARLEDRLFEGMQNGRSKAFPEQFLLAAKVGVDLSRVGWKFLHRLSYRALRAAMTRASQLKSSAALMCSFR